MFSWLVTRGSIIIALLHNFLIRETSVKAFLRLFEISSGTKSSISQTRVGFFFFFNLLFSSQVKARQADNVNWRLKPSFTAAPDKRRAVPNAFVLAAASCWLSFLSLYHLEVLILSKVQSQEGIWSQAWDLLTLSLYHCNP